jgi:hypothetical protein
VCCPRILLVCCPRILRTLPPIKCCPLQASLALPCVGPDTSPTVTHALSHSAPRTLKTRVPSPRHTGAAMRRTRHLLSVHQLTLCPKRSSTPCPRILFVCCPRIPSRRHTGAAMRRTRHLPYHHSRPVSRCPSPRLKTLHFET